jgi:iron complex outermembrane receptor protein
LNIPTVVSLIGDYRSTIAANDSNTVIAPSHLLWHLSIRQNWQWGDSEIQPWLKLHNATNRNYVGSVVVNQSNGRAFEPGVGRELQLGVAITQRW